MGLIVLLASGSSSLGADDGSDVSTLAVSGTGEATADADIVTIVLGVQTRDESAAAAVAENGRMMVDAIEALKAAGVPEEEIKTSRFSISPTRDWIDGRLSDKVVFEVNNQITFTLDLADEMDIGAFLDAAVGAGANTVESVTFALQDPKPVQEEALVEAVVDAMGKAGVISQAAGVSLGRVLSISEGGYSPIPMAESRAYLAADASAMTPIVPGDVMVTATVTITYEIQSEVVTPP
ncbi:SIMPL domain-containing protein [Methanotrichaceae archaeon M04Ac]|uniref:SIMPL domain-containing protein n=1 Tax=Candidatus Methanocrinis alkalitolerans TaxID=3033395 RepID=A0ABT5XD11_9EURY|nr:SIMPL domain-containing protein [Candidatus Methanocrinis alkalitolerans]MCR3882918.1 SIMPL domain-containing protein [Methanothrix sp.]MDF0592562.1 SIMPL domain-containing protein [Candidatus Methanocrinis alkalitolerans]